ncbi:hypothetical protein WJX75_001914 [Coccomyxa subellipsoidea]|uniref:Protein DETOXIFICATION n=1 Tax=Coccomyxa subellipsoidea TaxID=248742 RepID=A0ABR2YJ58_9CHLO
MEKSARLRRAHGRANGISSKRTGICASEDLQPSVSFVERDTEATTADLKVASADLDSQDMPILGVSEASGIITLPANDAASGPSENGADANGAKVGHAGKSEAAASPAAVQGHDVSSEAAEKGSLGAWELLRFTLPTLGIWIINPVLSLVDTSVVGTRSARELAALGPGTMLCDGNAYIFTFLAAATTNMLAISFARRDKAQASAILSDALVIALGLGVALAVAMYFYAPPALQSIAGQASAAVVEPAVTYVRIRCLGLPAALVIFVAQAFFLAAMDPMTPLLAASLAGIANLVGDIALVCGLGWGIAGASLATAVAQILTAGALLWALYRPLGKRALFPGWRADVRWRLPSLQSAINFVAYAGPIAGVLITKVIIYGVMTTVASYLGPVTVGAHHVVQSTYMFFCTCGDAVSQAAQSFLPGVVGKPKAAQNLGKQLMTTGLIVGCFNSICAGLVVVFAPALFTNSAEVVTMMGSMLPFMCTALVIHTASMATEGMLLAGRDLHFLLWSYVANMLTVLGALAALHYGPWPLTGLGLWWCLLQFQLFRLLVNGVRLLTHRSPLRSTQSLQEIMA